MELRHADDDLAVAEADPNYRGGIDRVLVRAFRKTLNLVRRLPNEVELRKYPSLHFEKLKGNRSHQYSMKLNDQWRVIVEIERRCGPNNNVCVIVGIEDYHH